jgi:hypothetical protein
MEALLAAVAAATLPVPNHHHQVEPADDDEKVLDDDQPQNQHISINPTSSPNIFTPPVYHVSTFHHTLLM